MKWWDEGDTSSAIGVECNYTTELEWSRNRLYKVSQTLNDVLLKATWAGDNETAKAQAESWELAYGGTICQGARNGDRRVR